MHMQQIPLKLLKLSPRNVRKTATGIDALAVSIAAHGLVHNLVAEKVNGHFEVIAGGRRLLALQQLEKAGTLPDELKEVRTLVIPAEGAAEVSMAENAMREPMHPADQFEAFKALLDSGEVEAEVAARFSVTQGFLRQRMKLANVSPKIIQAYRDGKLELTAVEAFALSDDHAEQEKVFKEAGSSEWNIRQALTKKAVPLTDKRIKAIGGVAAYEKAGGVVLRDMFSESDEGYAVDGKLVNRLVAEALEKKAAKLRADGWAFVDVGQNLNAWTYDKSPDAGKADKTKFGAIVSLTWAGKIETTLGLAKRQDQQASTKEPKPQAKPGDLPEKEAEALRISRDLRSALCIATNHDLGPAVLATTMAIMWIHEGNADGVDSLFGIECYGGDDAPEKDPAEIALRKIRDELRKIVPKKNVFAWAITQSDDVLQRILAFGAARCVELAGGYREDHGLALAALLDVDPAEGWKVTPDWLGKQTPAYVLEAVREACGQKVADEVAQTKGKGAIAGKAAKLLEDAGWRPAPLREAKKPAAKKAAKK